MDKLATRAAWLGRALLFVLLGTGTWLMLSASLSYLELADAHPFFLEKLPLRHPLIWQAALYVHVPSALFSLPACLVLLVRRVSARWPRLHRWLGRVTAALVVGAVVPSGMYLALFARGGLLSTLGFWLTGAITLVAMLKSVQSVRARQLRAHRRFSTHVAAQLAVAVFSRFMLVGLESLGLYSDRAYSAALWVPVVCCALAAELVTNGRGSASKGSLHEESASVVRSHAVR